MSGIYCEIILEPCVEYSPCWRGVCKQEFNFKYQTNFTCECSPGYTGQFCEKRLSIKNVCNSMPCKNNGKCVQKNDETFECLCLPEFEGELCESKKIINYAENGFDILQRAWTQDCRFRACENNGKCAENNNEHECQCIPGFAGRFCELDINECLSGIFLIIF